MFDSSTHCVPRWPRMRKESHSLSNTAQILKAVVYSHKVSLCWQRKLCSQRRKQVLNIANIRFFAVISRFQEPNITRSISPLTFFHIIEIGFRVSIPNSCSSSCTGNADVDIRVRKLNYFYESTLVMAKLRPELRKCLTNIRSNATYTLHSKYNLTCA